MIRPVNEAEVSEAIRTATGGVRIRGGGTRSVQGSDGADVLDMSALTGIASYDPGGLTMVARAGTPLAEIEATLAAEGQMLAFEPLRLGGLYKADGQSTIGGVVATNASGPRRIQVGACRDMLLGVRFVDGQGQVISNGGQVMKNVTGYDLVKLLCGSHGTLGVLTEVSLKVLPRPEATMTLFLHGLDPQTAVAAMARALGSIYGVTGAAHGTESVEEEPTTMIRLEGFGDSVRYRAGSLREILGRFGDVTVHEGVESWVAQRDMICFNQTVRSDGAVWRVSVKPTDAPALIGAVSDRFDLGISMDWGGGLIWVHCPDDQAAEVHVALRAQVTKLGGHVTVMRWPKDAELPDSWFQPQPAPLARIQDAIRAQFDPRGILNPGLMG